MLVEKQWHVFARKDDGTEMLVEIGFYSKEVAEEYIEQCRLIHVGQNVTLYALEVQQVVSFSDAGQLVAT